MKKEQGHTGGVAVLADQETPISLLRDIKRLLSLQQATDMPADGEEYRDYAILAGAGDLYIDTDVQFGYAYIPNCPRDVTLYSGTRGGLIGSFKAGAFVQFRMPRSTGVTVAYGAGAAAQTLTVYLSAREVEVGRNGEVAAVSPGDDIVAVTQSDTVNDANGPFRALIIGGAGIVKLTTPSGVDRTIPATVLSPQTMYPIKCVRVWSTTTTATDIYGVR